MSTVRLIFIALALLSSSATWAACQKEGAQEHCTGTGAANNDVLFTTGDADLYDTCSLSSTVGVVDVEVSDDGVTWSLPLGLNDQGVADIVQVLLTAQGQVYWFGVKTKYIRVLQNGATAASAWMRCWDQ